MEYYSAIKKNEIMSFAAKWMDPEIIILSEGSQKEKDKYYQMWNLKWCEWIYLENKLTDNVGRFMVAKGEGKGGRDGLGVWDSQL